jgi:hypothetical protein
MVQLAVKKTAIMYMPRSTKLLEPRAATDFGHC